MRLTNARSRRRSHRMVSPQQAIEILETRALLTAGFTFDFTVIATDLHPTFRTLDFAAPFTNVRYGEITLTSLTGLPGASSVTDAPGDIVIEFGSDDAATPEVVARLTGYSEGVLNDTPGVQNYRHQDGLDSDFVITNKGTAVAVGVVETIDTVVDSPPGPGQDPVVTSDNTRLRVTASVGPDTTIFDEIMDLTNGSGVIVASLNEFDFDGAATGFADSEIFTGTGMADIGEGSVIEADDLPFEFIEGAGPLQILVNTASDPAGRTELLSFTDPDKGTVTDNGDDTVNFVPDGGASGMTTFDYTVALKSLERTAGDPDIQDEFGHSVSVHSVTAVVGVPLEDSAGPTAGAVYVFEQDDDNEWREVQKLTASDAADIDRFGYSVHVSNDIIVVGARADDDNGTNSGSAYLFRKDNGVWTELKKLLDPNGQAKDQFGHSVYMDGDTVIVGSRLDDGSGTNSGSIFIFERNLGGPDNFGLVKQIKAPDASGGDQFGFSVSITDDDLIVGSRKDDSDVTAATDVGSAYIYHRDEGGPENWGLVTKIGGTGQANDWFGYSVSIGGGIAAAGTPIRNNRLRPGKVAIHEQNNGGVENWGETTTLFAPASTDADQFGFSVALNDDRILVGARNDDSFGNNAGAAYRFDQNNGGVDNWGLTRTYGGQANGDALGTTVSSSDFTFLISAPRRDNDGARSGSVYFESTETFTGTVTVDILGAPLLAPGPGTESDVGQLTSSQLAPVIDAAINQWEQQGLTSAQLETLENVTFTIDDLAENRLGLTLVDTIVIDSTAAGFGWYVDPTPLELNDDSIGKRIDLTTVVVHELGHVLGQRDLYGEEDADQIMFGFLEAGSRRSLVPTVPSALDLLFAGDEEEWTLDMLP